MSDELKSAWELALDRLRARDGRDVAVLTERQKRAIAEVRESFRRRRAEAQVLHEQAMRKAAGKGDRERMALLAEEHRRDLERLEQEERRRVQEIRERTDR